MLHSLHRGESYTCHRVWNGCRETVNANLQRVLLQSIHTGNTAIGCGESAIVSTLDALIGMHWRIHRGHRYAGGMKIPVIEKIEQLHDEMVGWRRDLHAHPELGFTESRTS